MGDFRGELASAIRGASLASSWGVGFLTDGELLDFKSPYPQGSTRLIGGEVTLDFNRLVEGIPRERGGHLALMYYWGHAEGTVSQDDLPLGDDPLANLIKFRSERESNSHVLLAEWRWPSNAPVYRSPHWTFIHPVFGLGAGGLRIRTRVIEGEGAGAKVKETTRTPLVATGSTQVHLVEFRWGKFESTLEGAVRLVAGHVFGMMGEGRLRLAYAF